MKNTITQSELKRRAVYDPDTGAFTSLLTGRALLSTEKQGYRVMRVGKDSYKQHRLAFLYMTGDWPKHVVDHINGVKTDNRWTNLRDVPIAHNLQNVRLARRTSATGVLGVYRTASGRFYSQIQVLGKFIRVGVFDSVKEAQQAYLSAKEKLHEGYVS